MDVVVNPWASLQAHRCQVRTHLHIGRSLPRNDRRKYFPPPKTTPLCLPSTPLRPPWPRNTYTLISSPLPRLPSLSPLETQALSLHRGHLEAYALVRSLLPSQTVISEFLGYKRTPGTSAMMSPPCLGMIQNVGGFILIGRFVASSQGEVWWFLEVGTRYAAY